MSVGKQGTNRKKRPLTVLGISAMYHDSAAAMTRDGIVIAAAQEERFTRKKHDKRFPVNAINYCLEEAEIEPEELDAIAFYDNPVLTLDRIMRTLAFAGPVSLDAWLGGAPDWLATKPFIERLVKEALGEIEVPVLFCEHHFSHAASAFYPSPFEEAAILTIDGVGEWATTTLGIGSSSGIEVLKEIHFPHSLGLLYSAFTQFCGFKVNSGEYKLMGLAPYGRPKYADAIRRELIDVKEDGSFHLNMDYFAYLHSRRTTSDKFAELFGGPGRKPETMITRREMDLAASIQVVTEEVVLKLCHHLRDLTKKDNLCMAGGVALNCVANGKVVREKIFDRVWIQPAAGDAGGAIGAAQMITHQYFNLPRAPVDPARDRQQGSFLGPRYSNAEIRTYLDQHKYPYEVVDDATRARLLAEELAAGKVVGYAVGRMEFGPRALGGRSILGDARSPETQSVMNLKIKFRESFRPFAPSVLRERAKDYFDLDVESPYMMLIAPVKESIRKPVEAEETEDLIRVVNQARSTIPAVTHVDYSARIQTVDREQKPDFYELLSEFEKLTGVATVVNTSFNVRGEPIVCAPQDAYQCFMRSQIDVLVLENCILRKEQQPKWHETGKWQAEYELD